MKTTKWMALVALVLMATSCSKNETKDNSKTECKAVAHESTGVIAYVEYDSVMSNYQFFKDYTAVMEQQYTNMQKTLAEKQRTIQQHETQIQNKYNNNGYTTRDELDRAQAGLQREYADYQALNDRLSAELANQDATYTKEILDSMTNFINRYNSDGRYDYILSKSGQNILYANPALDITDEIIEGLNKNYTIKSEFKEKLGK